MKRVTIVVMMAALAAGAAVARDFGPGDRGPGGPNGPGPMGALSGPGGPGGPGAMRPGAVQPTGAAVTVQGTLTLAQGTLAVVSGGTTYLVPRLSRYVGFIDSLKEGAQVKLEGTAFASQDAAVKNLAVDTLTVGGKSYDLSRPKPEAPNPPDPPPQGGTRLWTETRKR